VAVQSKSGKALLRKRGEHIERSFAHVLDQGGMRRATLRGTENLTKRLTAAALAYNLSLLMRKLFGFGTPKQWAAKASFFGLLARENRPGSHTRLCQGDRCLPRKNSRRVPEPAKHLSNHPRGRALEQFFNMLLGRLFGDPFPSPRSLAGLRGDDLTEIVAKMAARAREIGVDLALAPSIDLAWKERGDLVFTERLFSADAGEVIASGRAFLNGLRAGGLKSCLKHFPGLGRSAVDPHCAASCIAAVEESFFATDLQPFRELCGEADSVMLTHHCYSFLEPETPASFSGKAIHLLRHALGFRGLVLTDNLTMQALSGTPDSRVQRALEAGNDLAMLSRGKDRNLEVYLRIWKRLNENGEAYFKLMQ
jgi:beta-glucosidase-like glycosyl hydrolase